MANSTLVRTFNPSAKIIIVLQLYLSIQTPANDPSNKLDKNDIIVAIVNVMADSLWAVNHPITANYT